MIVEEDLKYLRESGCSEYVIRHSIAVARKALDIANRVKVSVDKSLIKEGGINHDIGRSRTQALDHAVVGAEIAGLLGFDKKIVRIIERHIGAGIPKEEAIKLGLPERDYIPETPEEVIVSYSDNLVRGDSIELFEEALQFFKRNLGEDHPSIGRFLKMHEMILSWL